VLEFYIITSFLFVVRLRSYKLALSNPDSKFLLTVGFRTFATACHKQMPWIKLYIIYQRLEYGYVLILIEWIPIHIENVDADLDPAKLHEVEK
jgi:hypothetical protein